MTPRALVTGISGQDGSYMADLLLSKGYEVHGITRRISRMAEDRTEHLLNQVVLHHGDLTDQGSLDNVVAEVQPDEIYNLGAMSFVGSSWKQPALTAEVTGLGALRVLESMRHHAPEARFYQASSSEQFGNQPGPQNEDTPFRPRSPYGVAKVFAHNIAVNYRESYGLHVSCGILFNHESERRGSEFVTRKITRGVARVVLCNMESLALGNLESRRDWGYAPEYVEAMWRMLQRDEPDDYVIATGQTRSVQDFVEAAFEAAEWEHPWRDSITIDPRFVRPAELHVLEGDASKAREVLGWEPTISFKEMVRRMVQHDLDTTHVQAAA